MYTTVQRHSGTGRKETERKIIFDSL
jgi:hypothetical protein